MRRNLTVHLIVLVVLAMSCGNAVHASSLTVSLTMSVSVTGQQRIDPATVVGHQACQECHKSEVAAWLQSSHATKSFKLLTENPNAKKFGDELGISDVTSVSATCTECHGLRQSQGGKLSMLSGNSCEACHGGAGPKESGWFRFHSDFGGESVTRDQETEAHFQTRLATCDKLGMNRSEDVYDIVKNCLQCHSVSHEEVVNAGHPIGDTQFEFVAWAQGEVRHNFQRDQTKNAESPTLWTHARFREPRTTQSRKQLMYVVGQLVDLEVSIRNRAKATGRGNFATALVRRITGMQRQLAKINRVAKLPEITAALNAAKPIKRARLRKFEADDAKFFGDIADAIAEQAKAISKNRDGSGLGGVASMLPKSVQGNVFMP